MPKFSRPQGAYFQNTPDRFVDALGYIGGFYPDPGGAFQSFSTFWLLNSTNTTQSIYVYFISAFWNGASIILCDLTQTRPPGSAIATGQSVSPIGATLPGELHLKSTVVGGSPPNPDITSPTAFLGLGFASAGIGFNAPLFIIPPGWSLRMSNDFVSAESGITIWYTAQ